MSEKKSQTEERIDTISSARKNKIRALNFLMVASFVIILAILILIIGYILCRGIPYVTWEMLSTEPSVLKNTYGILPNILNTLYIVIITLIIVLPIGVGAAIYLNEYARNKKIVRMIEFATETLSGIPSIIYGLAGMLIFCQFFGLGTGMLAGSLTLVIMTLPTIIRTTQESLKTVPNSYREGSLAMGAGKWHMIRTVVLPSAIDGIVTGCILAVGRVVGESAALLFTAGMANKIVSFGRAITPGTSGASLTVALYMYAMERNQVNVAFAIAVILLLLTFLINFAAKLVAYKLKKKVEQ
ncbi:MAG: phosphate ABC transporter permease PstA [Stecheria intestinalis]|uniref:phosphate ABC transporter permease PstA n=1 Tax=Stecheria intestinalis TaxID=2606630 RepID=UPI0023F46167|nr:phosphate ABC transporter permease PstA [Stecheria intestinalis]MDD5882017.1 phosphate ABC transporter permease PstA [Stecheria intestinalis]MDD6367215.1 phosphate ABC transporter permease PstA [Stecheria intestinalis]